MTTDPRIRAAEALEATCRLTATAGAGRWEVRDGTTIIAGREPTAGGSHHQIVGATHVGVDAAWIALVDPTVGRAVAAWLRANAEAHKPDPYDETWCVDDSGNRWKPCPDAAEAIALARVLLREGGDGRG